MAQEQLIHPPISMTTENKNDSPPSHQPSEIKTLLASYRRTVTAVARRFAVDICNALDFDTVTAVDEANARESNPDICHSHDYCDANVYMRQAILDETGLDAAGSALYAQVTSDLWNAAWKEAKRCGFRRLGQTRGHPDIPARELNIKFDDRQMNFTCDEALEPSMVALDHWGRNPHLQVLCYEAGTEEPVVSARYSKEGKVSEVIIIGKDSRLVISVPSLAFYPCAETHSTPWEIEREANVPCVAGDKLYMPSGQTATVMHLRDRYKDIEEFRSYAETYGLLQRMDGYPGSPRRNGVFTSVEQAWEVNPLTASTTDPSDFSTVPTDKL